MSATVGASELSRVAGRAEAAMNGEAAQDDALLANLMQTAFVEGCAGLEAELAMQLARSADMPN